MPDEENNPPVRRTCGVMIAHNRLLERYASYRENLMLLESATKSRLLERVMKRSRVTTIPVVVHVLYNKESEKISDSQIESQITVMNDDFNAMNGDRMKTPAVWQSLVASLGITFTLNEITRTHTNVLSFDANDKMKSSATGGKNPKDPGRYLNIWVCTLANSLLGYAQFPGGPVETDGVVILNTAFGTNGTARAPFNKGRTATHEVGHYFNLRHIWGDTDDCHGTDHVDDTPNQKLPNYGKPVFPKVSCNNGPNGDMFMNYMDYVDDDAMFMFTLEQIARMNATLDGPRRLLGT